MRARCTCHSGNSSETKQTAHGTGVDKTFILVLVVLVVAGAVIVVVVLWLVTKHTWTSVPYPSVVQVSRRF